MELFLTIVLFVCGFATSSSATAVNEGRPIFCSNATISEIRIQNCDREPCTLKKGTHLSYQIDFNFTEPRNVDSVSINAFAPYWNVPGTGAYGTNLSSRNGTKCGDFARRCPAPAGTKYTIKSTLYADPKLQRTVGDKEKTGKVRTGWLFTPSSSKTKNGDPGSQCAFNVEFNLVN